MALPWSASFSFFSSQLFDIFNVPVGDFDSDRLSETLVSPMSSLTGYWKIHPDFHSFLLVSYSHFSNSTKDVPSFPLAAVGDKSITVGYYNLSRVRLMRHVSKGWINVHVFNDTERENFEFDTKPRYFQII